MLPSPSDPLRIGAVGLDRRRCDALRLMFNGHGKKAYQLVDDHGPEAWVVDLDFPGALKTLAEKVETCGDRPALFLAVEEPPAPVRAGGLEVRSVFLRKPFRIEDFVAALPALALLARPPIKVAAASTAAPVDASRPRVDGSRIAQADATASVARKLDDEATQGLVGHNEDIDLADPVAREKIFYRPARYLQGHLERQWPRAIDAGRPLVLHGPWPPITLLPGEGRVHLAAALRHYRPFAIVPDLDGERREVFEVDASQRPSGVFLPYQNFLWTLALWAARGRVPQDTDLETPAFLRLWPNFTRLEISPGALAIAALWAREPHGLARTAAVLRLPQRYVFAFYSATQAIGLSGISRREIDLTVERKPLKVPPEGGGVLARIMRKLRLAGEHAL